MVKLKNAPVGSVVRWEGELFTVMGEDVPNRNGSVGYKWGKGVNSGDWISSCAEVELVNSGDWISSCAEVELVNEGPVRTVTRREIVPGTYGVVRVDKSVNGYVFDLWKANADAEELREAAHVLNQIAEALED